MRQSIILTLILLLTITFSVNPMSAQAQTNNGVYLLQPDIVGAQPGTQESSLGNYLSLLFNTLIGLAGGIAVLIITIEGLKYIMSEIPGVKMEAKGRIRDALIGLVLALSAYLILYTINPDLINLSLKLDPLKTSPTP